MRTIGGLARQVSDCCRAENIEAVLEGSNDLRRSKSGINNNSLDDASIATAWKTIGQSHVLGTTKASAQPIYFFSLDGSRERRKGQRKLFADPGLFDKFAKVGTREGD
ncbi:MAG: hypothetical protein AB7P20_27545 [Rhizobiaceae bacterium]